MEGGGGLVQVIKLVVFLLRTAVAFLSLDS